MIRTRVGYTGGTRDSPTYHRLGNHTEALQVDFETDDISYPELLEEVFKRHNPFRNIGHTQYMNAVWFHDRNQKALLEEFLSWEYDATIDDPSLETRIEPIDTFHRAEAYHQKYHLRKHDRYMQLFENYTERDFTDSTLAARLNGILAGNGSSLEVFPTVKEQDFPDLLERDLISRIE